MKHGVKMSGKDVLLVLCGTCNRFFSNHFHYPCWSVAESNRRPHFNGRGHGKKLPSQFA
jgi:hypothetical protein